MPRLGIADLASSRDTLDFSSPFCIKPLVGSKGKDVHVWMPKPDGSRDATFSGGSTKSQVIRALEMGPCIRQPFIPTGTEDIDGICHYKLMRLFAVMTDAGKYEIVPSPYVMRPNVKIHGSSDAINGLITFI